MYEMRISKPSATFKHRQVRDKLLASIRSGEFPAGHQLPAEYDLAARFGVSHMTARRAVIELVETGIVERRARKGTFIRALSPDRLALTTLQLVCATYESSLTRAFLTLGARAAERRGWGIRVVRMHSGHDHAGIQAVLSGEPALVLMDAASLRDTLGEALRKADGRAVLLGNRLDPSGDVPAVVADDAQAIRLAVEHLQAAGHQHIALLCNHPSDANEQVQVGAWRACLDGLVEPSETARYLASANTPRYQCATPLAYEVVRRQLDSDWQRVSALVCLGDELALGALAACRDAGRPVPGRMSLVNSGDSALMAYAHPPVTCINVDMERHLELAIAMLEAGVRGDLPASDRLRLVDPHLVERRSVAAPWT